MPNTVGNAETKITLILKGLTDTEEQRRRLINGIEEKINCLQSVERMPKPDRNPDKREDGNLNDILNFIDKLHEDNDRLEEIANTLSKIC